MKPVLRPIEDKCREWLCAGEATDAPGVRVYPQGRMGPARIYPWRKMHRSRAPSIAPGTFFVAQSWADCITNMAGFNLRQAHPYRRAMTCWPRLLPAPSLCLQHFATPFPMAKHRVPARATDHLVRRSSVIMPPPCAQAPVEVLWCLDCFRPIPVGFNHREDRPSGTPALDGD
jgi:hypothetical protein